MNDIPTFTESHVEQIARVLGDTSDGLTNSEIDRTLRKARIRDVSQPGETKWIRIYNALAARQNKDGTGDRVLGFIRAALDPIQYPDRPTHFESQRRRLNVVLAFAGLQYEPEGKFIRIAKARTLGEAHARADRLRSKLLAREVHPETLRYCTAELLADNYFHAALEAAKSVAATIRTRTGLTGDGADLVKKAFLEVPPRLLINGWATDSEKGEQRGFANLLIGMFGTFRNPTAHAPRIEWNMSEEDALDLMTLTSYAHRRIAAATLGRGGTASA